MIKQKHISILISLGLCTTMCSSLTLAEEERTIDNPREEETHELEEESVISEENEEVSEEVETEIQEETSFDEKTEEPAEETLSEEDGSQPDIDVHPPKIDDGMFHYIDENGNDHSTDAHLLEYIEDRPNSVLDGGWYIITHDWTFYNRLVAGGNTKLILADGVTLTMNHGIRVDEGIGNIEIFGQSTDPDIAGKLICGAYDSQAGLGGNNGCKNGEIIIHSGTVEANGGSDGAGIGGGNNADGGIITILGGTVTALGGNSWNGAGAGIGGGNHGDGGTINVAGGSVNATGANWGAGIGGGNCGRGGSITINGGVVFAYGGNNAAGIGGGDEMGGGIIVINGGFIEAFGGSDGAGIGGGSFASGGNVLITGGDIEACGGNSWIGAGAGIGGGNNGSGEEFRITGGTVKAIGASWAAGIGGGYNGDGGAVTFEGGKTYAEGKNGGAGIGSGKDGVSREGVRMWVIDGEIEAHGYEAMGSGSGACGRVYYHMWGDMDIRAYNSSGELADFYGAPHIWIKPKDKKS